MMVPATFTIGGDLTVSRLGFGAGRITGDGYWGPPADRDTARTVLRYAVDHGVTLVDTADNYGPDISEELIAAALHPYPADLVVTTKGGVVRTGPNRWHHAGRPEQLRAACQASLRRLRLETIPLYQLHRIDPAVPLADQLGTLLQLRREGKIRHLGLDTVTAEQLRNGLALAPIASVQNHYNLHHRVGEEVLRLCEEQGIAFLPYLPLSGGALTSGNHSHLDSIAKARQATPGQVALAWLLHRSPNMLPTPGTASLEHLADNLGAAQVTLTSDDMRILNNLTG
jgi:pyridoxine 4-dehydrogenase